MKATIRFFMVTVCLILSANIVLAQTIPDTDDTKRRQSTPPQPGWTKLGGSCDTSDLHRWAANGAPLWVGGSYPPPTGHTYFLSCGSWFAGGESAFATISGLTVGVQYTFSFYVAGMQPQGLASPADGDSYRITVGNDDSGTVSYNSTGWIAQDFVFTADSSSETISIYGPTTDDPTRYRLTHFSFASDAVAGPADYSDAPASYGDAEHTIVPGVYLGAGDPDADAASLAGATTNATGDDLDGSDDEDGVVVPGFTSGETTLIRVTVADGGTGNGRLQAWIDWDQSGAFDAGEQVSLDLQDDGTGDDVAAADGAIQVNVAVPGTATVGTTFARFRWSTTAGLDATTAASDGEVEDYKVAVMAPPPVIAGTCDSFGADLSEFPTSDFTSATATIAPGVTMTIDSPNLPLRYTGSGIDVVSGVGDLFGTITMTISQPISTLVISAIDYDFSGSPLEYMNGFSIPPSGATGQLQILDTDDNGVFDTVEPPFTNASGTVFWSALPGGTTVISHTHNRLFNNLGVRFTGIDVELEGGAAACPQLDYSDAPASYGDATHTIVSGVYLGAGDPDADAASLASANADGDDLDGTDDEDGVTLPASFRQGLTEAISVAVTGAGGFLQGWIDWDQSGTFDVGEQVSLDLQDDGTGDDVTAGDGTIELNVAVPAGAAVGTSFARFRWSTTAGLDATTAAADGEVEDYQATIQSLTPFTCEAKLYQVYGFAGVLSEIDLATGTVDIATMGGNLNAFGYRVLNGLAYGFDRDNSHLLVVDANGTKVDLGAVSGLGIAPNVGDFGPDGFLHATLVGGTTIYRINVDTRTVVDSYTTSSGANSGDWAFDTVTGLFYSIVAANLVSADPVTGTTTVIGPTNVATGSYGAVFADAAGSVFALHNATGQVYWLDTATGNGVLVTSASTATRNDGFSCPDATIPVVDRSDAPASYGDATHSLDSQVRLGSLLDADAVSLAGASTDATGDDVDGVDDEDGVSLPTMVQGETVSISVAATGAGGYLQAWIDWNGNGTFDVSEQIALDLQDDGTGDDTTAADGVIEFNITVPFTAVTSQTFARFRWSTTAGLDATTAAIDGEVEDYAMIIAPTEVALGEVSLEYIALNDFSIATLRAILSGFEEIAEIGELTEGQLRQRVASFLDHDGDGLVGEFRWETLSQRGTLGFYVERQQSNGTWQRLQTELQPAMIPAPYGAEYRNWDPSAIKGEILIYRLIEQETNGQLKTYGPFQLQ